MQQLESAFYERGAPHELILDNNTAFRNNLFRNFAEGCGISLRFRCACVVSGNGIVECCHSTVKTIAAGKDCPIAEAVYRYNTSPRSESSCSPPANRLYNYDIQVKDVNLSRAVLSDQDPHSWYRVGDNMWVKSPHAPCVTKCGTGRVTDVLSQQAVEVNRVPRHVRDLRLRMSTEDECKQAREEKGELEECPWFIGRQTAHGRDYTTESETSKSEKEVT